MEDILNTPKAQYYIMMHHLWKYANQDKDLGKYDLDKAWSYFEAIEDNHGQAPSANSMITANGRKVLTWMKDNPNNMGNFLASDIGKGLGITSQSVSGTMRKLITEGFVIKGQYSKNLVCYTITDEGIAAVS